jgi:nitroreductase
MTITNMSANDVITKSLNARYATKVYDTTKKISPEDFATIKEALRLTPSSYGIQPWKFVWVDSAEVRAKLVGAAYGQAQVGQADKLLVIAAKTDMIAAIDEYVADMATKSGQPKETFADFEGMMKGTAAMATDAWYQKQCYIALGVAIETAAILGIDAGPMEGFDAAAYDEILGLSELGLHSTVILSFGYRADSDAHAKDPKVRFSAEQLNITV